MTLVVGMPASLSGQFQAQGRQALAGLQAWARDANANAKTSSSFAVLHYDDASDPATVRAATQRLIVDDRVDILMGPYSGVLTFAAAEVAESYGKLLWNQGGASDRVYQQGYRWTVGILTPASGYLTGLLPLVRQTDPSATTVALVRASTGEFPKSVCSGVAERAGDLGFTVGLAAEFPASTSDFSTVLDDLRHARPDVVVIVGRVRDDLRMAKQIAESGINAGAAVAVAAGIQEFQDELGSLAQGYVGPSQWEPEAADTPDFGPTADQVIASLRRDGHRHVDYPLAQAYAAGVVVEKCLEEAGSADNLAMREAASNLDFLTFYGRFKIDRETGRQIGRETLLVQWQGGQKVIVWPPKLAQGEQVYPWR